MSGRRLAEAIALFFKQTPAERMATAQQRGALPINQGGLGLPANNTPDQRADILFPRTVYRGIGAPVNLFRPRRVNDPVNYPRAGNSYRKGSEAFSAIDEPVARTYSDDQSMPMPMRLDDRGFATADFEGRKWNGLDFDDDDLSAIPHEIFNEIEAGDAELEDYAFDLPLIDAAGDQIGYINRANTNKIAHIVSDRDYIFEYGEPTPQAELSLLDPSDPEVYDDLFPDLPGVRIDNVLDIGIMNIDNMDAYDYEVITSPHTVFVSKQERMRHAEAAFDPFLKGWDHILAGAAGTGILLDQIPYDEQKQGSLYVE